VVGNHDDALLSAQRDVTFEDRLSEHSPTLLLISYPLFVLKDLWIRYGMAVQAADAKHTFPRAAPRVSVG
jgi:hypothetical protein